MRRPALRGLWRCAGSAPLTWGNTLRKTLRTLIAATSAAAVTGGLLAVAASPATAAPSGLQGDFNGDGYRDLAIAAPLAKVGGKSNAGSVSIVYGGKSGLNTAKSALIHQNTPGIPGAAEQGDMFGDTLAAGDLDGDNYTDLVVGVHADQVGKTDDSGSVTVVWGGARGLGSGTDLSSPLPDSRNAFGWDVAVGDFTGDGAADIAVLNGVFDGLHVFKGPISRKGVAEGRQDMDALGHDGVVDRIVAGEVDGRPGMELLALGHERGAVLTAGGKGLRRAGLVPGGYSAAIGDVDKDGYGDVVTGNFAEKSSDEPTGTLGGGITVSYGAMNGLSDRARVRINQDTKGVPGTAEKNDFFGWSVSAGDTDGDGYADVAIGAIGESIGKVKQTGTVTVLRGSAKGLTGAGAKSFAQSTKGVPGSDEAQDGFGYAVKLSDIDGDGRSELAASAFAEDKGAGAVWRFRTDKNGVTATGSASFNARTVGGVSGLSYFGSDLVN
ncbi:hypothetical protein FFZ77_16140 [Streptomyces katsurahamanus]|uniref:VCBS repeat-containing protein n=1 Tax=Streptomyces katsurahamanus TaxID=2577098 RepID=A0ABW9NUX2_9ACTN|nr:hypothetical protein [Streptomyces katsurahamanus]